jgi:hypothetical protein
VGRQPTRRGRSAFEVNRRKAVTPVLCHRTLEHKAPHHRCGIDSLV